MKSKPQVKRWIIVQDGKLILSNCHDLYFTNPSAKWICGLEVVRQFSIGFENHIEYLVADIDENFSFTNNYQALNLKQALPYIDITQHSMVFKAFSILYWDRNHKYCGACGKETITRENKFEKICKACKIGFFPRISPSIIVLVHHHDELIMARSPHFAPGVYSLIAGFVEIGETVEGALRREVKEEVGIEVKNIIYQGSQPWPFPDALMLGFTAEYASGEIMVDKTELEDAGWYKYNNLPGRPNLNVSIASRLIDDFIKKWKV